MKIFIITICNKNENYEKIIEKFEKLISIFYEIELVNINFKTEKTKKNTYKRI